MNLSKITIVIPSYERQKYLIKKIKYWSNFEVDVHIVDGSDKPLDHLKFENFKRVKYHHIKILSEVDRLKKILPLINTKYSILSSDDDFLLLNGLNDCLDELEGNKDLVSCYGQTLSFYRQKDNVKFFRTDKGLYNFENNGHTACTRLQNQMKNYTPSIIYSLMRTEYFKNIFDIDNFSRFKYYSSLEIRATLLINYYGKSKVIKSLLVLRNKEEKSATKRNFKNTSFFLTMFHPSQKRNRKDFTDELVKSIKKIFQVDESRTSKMFEKALRTYLIFTIKRFFKKKLFLLFINNLNFFFKRRRSEKLSRLIDFPDLKYYCDSKEINLNENDYNLIEKFLINNNKDKN